MQTDMRERKAIRLLKKGQKGIVHAIFSRLGLILLLFLFQVFLMFGIFSRFVNFLPHYLGGALIFTVVMMLYLLNSSIDPTAKITWVLTIVLLPVFGAALFWYTQKDPGHRALKRRLGKLLDDTKDKLPQAPEIYGALKKEDPGAAALAGYLQRIGNYPVYSHTEVTYFPSGEDKFAELLKQLELAEHFIFMEYFIIDEGIMWGEVLEILARKAAAGVEIRVLYDGTCEFTTLPYDYPKRLGALGIQCKMFAPLTPFVSTHYNNRDHRKILVIDGHTAFNGGINLADEYINLKNRFGHWKDTAVMLKGDAVRSFTLMFLQMWEIDEKKPEFDKYLRFPTFPPENAPGFVIPYGDSPLDKNKVGERVYMDILNRAKEYVHIMTPYLILDGEMETALKYAAERGVEVVLILPGIPDKKAPYALAKTHYKSLMESGIEIYEYTPGFVHAKVFVSDDREAVVGTINLDYRSLYHHFECGTYLNGSSCIPQIEEDFQETLSKCRRVTAETMKKEKLRVRLAGYLIKVVAPLL